MIKTTPMIFNSEMVRALLAGNKTQTRRIFKEPKGSFLEEISAPWLRPTVWFPEKEKSVLLDCPFGMAGDLIYVRETFRLFNSVDECDHADFPCPCPNDNAPIYRANFNDREEVWKPSIHMPRWVSRLTLKINSVRVERIQDISGSDCIAEGFNGGHGSIEGYGYSATPKEHFSHTWNSIYPNSYEKNQWVWVIDFEVIHKNIDQVLAEMEQAA